LARDGIELVLAPALRFGEEPFLKHLDGMGVLPPGRQRGSAEPLVVTGRQLVSAAVNSLHPETLSYEWATPYFVTDFVRSALGFLCGRHLVTSLQNQYGGAVVSLSEGTNRGVTMGLQTVTGAWL
jgi:hypothetical protein